MTHRGHTGRMHSTKSRNTLPTLGLLSGILENEYEVAMWYGGHDAARYYDVNLVYVSGGILSRLDQHDHDNDALANILYELVTPEQFDGLVIWGALLAHIIGAEGVRALCQRYHELSIINIGLPLPGISSLFVDNYQGMYDVVSHLIEVHGNRRIAFLQGPEANPEVRERYRGYVEALANHADATIPANIGRIGAICRLHTD